MDWDNGATEPADLMDPELTNYKTRVAVTWGVGDGSDKGVAYAEEYLWSNKLQWDAKVVYLRQDTAIRMAITDPSLPETAKIRYKIDRDRQWYGKWCPLLASGQGTAVLLPQYTAPFTLADLTFEPGVPVVGTVGHNGGPENSQTGRYYRGTVAPNGDIYHTLMYAIDNFTAAIAAGQNPERAGAFDAKSVLIVEEPKAPAFCPRATGTGQFFTRPHKAYWTPRVVEPETVFAAGTAGTVTFQIIDIYGNNVSYRINGGGWINAGASSVTLTQDAFAEGANTIEYRYAGNETFARTRTLIKNPAHPSLLEPHGHYLWGDTNGEGWERVAARAQRPGSKFKEKVDGWRTSNKSSGSGITEWIEQANRGAREVPSHKCLINSFLAKLYGFGWMQGTRQVALYAKEMLLESLLCVDTTGFEMNHSSDALPNRTRHKVGYEDSKPSLLYLYAYDLWAGNFRSDPSRPANHQVNGGLTPVEDYFVRDRLASFVHDALLWSMGGQPIGDPGMWGGSRMMAAMQIAIVMPEFSSPLWGTSGFGTVQTTYPDTPFGAGQRLTWKQALWDVSTELTAFPRLTHRFTPGLLFTDAPMVKAGVTYPAGSWKDNSGYFTHGLMQFHIFAWANIAARVHGRYDARLLAAMRNAVATEGMYCIGSNLGPTRRRYSVWLLLNSYFPDLATANLTWWLGLATTEAEAPGKALNEGDVFSLAWAEDDWDSGAPVYAAPSFITSPLSQTAVAGETVVFSVLPTGSPTPTLQWRKNGVAIAGQIGLTLTITAVNSASSGSYDCVATNTAGTATSAAAVLAIVQPPTEPPAPGSIGTVRSAHAPLYAITL